MFLEFHTLKNQKKDEYFAAVRSGLERDCKSMDQKINSVVTRNSGYFPVYIDSQPGEENEVK